MICSKHGEVPEEKIYVTKNGYKKCKFCRAEHDQVYREKKRNEILERRRETGRKFRENNREKVNAEKREYYWRTRNERLAQKRKYQEENKEKIREKNKLWYQRNKEKKNQHDKIYYAANREILSIKKKEWRENNKDYFNELSSRRVKELRSSYIKSLLLDQGFKGEVPIDIVELKKILIRIKRQARKANGK